MLVMFCGHHILTSFVICYFADPQQHGIHLFYMIKKQSIVNGEVIYASVL